MKKSILLDLCALVLAGVSSSQAAGVHRGFLLGGANVSSGVSWVLQLDARNHATLIRTGAPGFPIGGNFWGVTMDASNDLVLLGG